MIPPDTHLRIGSLLFDGLDQIDLTGPFEVLSRIPNATYRLYGKTVEAVRDVNGLRLTPVRLWLTRRNSMCCTCLAAWLRSLDGRRRPARLDPNGLSLGYCCVAGNGLEGDAMRQGAFMLPAARRIGARQSDCYGHPR
jgi:hypothetical protein